MSFDLVFKLERSQPLMVEYLTDLSAVELEVRVGEVAEGNTSDEEQHVCVIALALGFERIVAQLVAVRFIVNVVLFLPGVTMRIG
jgi:hypothetical protein